ncbi:hypothetical protein BIW11_13575 [Tropilaelaps mercedesae]|uniref:Uncharacterized protein n=1 Tax=Tropilaelaps mercedesae TaxID=418985 RepID=A0A1V9X1J4_9ACAR|nr:hypothetical protein BIW11_13575 [Tropilaelaps mercedesae]
MPPVRDVEMTDGRETLNFSRDGRIRVERYTVDELVDIADLIRSRKPFQHLLKSRKLQKQRQGTETTNCPFSRRSSDPSQPFSMASPSKEGSRPAIYSSGDESDSEDSENDIENADEDASVDDEIFRQLFRPIVTTSVQRSSSPQKPQPPSKELLNGENNALVNEIENSNESSLCLELASSSSAGTTSMSSGSFESHVDDETFNRVFRPVSLTNSNEAESNAVEKMSSPRKMTSFLFTSTQMESIPPVGVFAAETPDTTANGAAGSPRVEVTACSTPKAVLDLEPQAIQDKDKELSSAVDPFASANLQNYLKIYRESKVKLPDLVVPKQEQIARGAPLRSPSPSKRHLPAKRRFSANRAEIRNNSGSSARKSEVSKALEYVFAKSSPVPGGPSTSKGSYSTNVPQSQDPGSSSDLLFHTSDSRSHPDWNDTVASRVLRRGLLFVKKGGHVSASRYSNDFRSSPLTVNAVVYACSATTSAVDVVAKEDAGRREELAQRLAAKENVIVKQEHTSPQIHPVGNSSSKRAKKVTRNDVSTAAINGISQDTSAADESPDKLGITRCGRTIRRVSHLSDYVVGTPRYSAKRTMGKRKEKPIKTETAPTEVTPKKYGKHLVAKVQRPARPTGSASSSRRIPGDRQIPESAGDPARTGDWGSTGSVDPFTSSGEDCEPDDHQPPEDNYALRLANSLAHQQRHSGEDILTNVYGDGPTQDTIAPVMFVADVTSEASADTGNGKRKARRMTEEVSSFYSNNNSSRDPYVIKIKQEPGLAPEATGLATQDNCSALPQPDPGSECSKADDTAGGNHHEGRNLVIHPCLGITDAEEVAAIRELHDLIYDEPRTVTVEQLMDDLRKSFCVELRSHEQLLRWKKFLTMRNMEMRARLKNMKRLQRCADLQRKGRRRKTNDRNTKLVVSKKTTRPQLVESLLQPEQMDSHTQPSMKLTIKKCLSKGRIVYITPEGFGDPAASETCPSAEGSPPVAGIELSDVPIPPPSLFVHQIAAAETQVVPISPIIPATQILKVSPPLPASASICRFSTVKPSLAMVTPPRGVVRPVQRTPIILKPINGKLAGSPPRIIRRLIPINRTPGGVPIVTPLSMPSILSNAKSRSQPAPLLRQMAVRGGNVPLAQPGKTVGGGEAGALPNNQPKGEVQAVADVATELVQPTMASVASHVVASDTGADNPKTTSNSGQWRIQQRRKRKDTFGRSR